MRARSSSLVELALVLGLCLAATPTAWAAPEDAGRLELGLLLPQGGGDFAPPRLAENERAPLTVRVSADWAEIERTVGTRDWSSVEPIVDRWYRAGHRIALSLGGSHPVHQPGGALPDPTRPESLRAWLDLVRSAVRTFGDRIELLVIGDATFVGPSADAAAYAYLLKNSALEARAEAEANSIELAVAQLPVVVTDYDWQLALWQADIAAYIDVIPVALGEGGLGSLEGDLRRILDGNLRHPPAASVWAVALASDNDDPWAPAAAAVAALAAGADRALVGLPAEESRADDVARWTLGLQLLLDRGFAPAPVGALQFTDADGAPLADATVVGRFLDESDFSSLIVYRAPGEEREVPTERLLVDSSFVRNARLIDPLSGRELAVGSAPLEGRSGRSIRITTGAHPRAVLFQRPSASAGFELPPEQIETVSGRELTAEEIIARHQQVREVQEDRLDRWMADARIEYHFKLAQGGATIDVAIDSKYFWTRDGDVEWEQMTYYVNGNRVTWKNIPELPLIQPEKVITLPLDLTLDRSYRVRKVGDARVGGRDAYVLAFEPPAEGLNLYRGRVWIDRETFVALKTNLIQTELDAPVISNEEVDLFAPFEDGSGRPFQLLSRVDGQQIWTAGGRNLLVRREITFQDYQINPEPAAFETRRAEAYASNNQMLRDTDDGFRYLERQEDGSRTVKTTVDSDQLFAAAGAFRDGSGDSVTPLAGVNYFNYDLFGKNIQTNVLFAGPLLFANLTKPDLFGKRMDFTVDLFGSGLKFDDEVFSGDQELELERIRSRAQNLALRYGVPVGQFFKLTLVGDLEFRQYDTDRDVVKMYDAIRADPLDPRDLEFLLPEDHTLLSGTVVAEFNRRGWSAAVEGSWSRRSDWSTWGLFDNSQGSFVAFDEASGSYVPVAAEPVLDSYSRWQAAFFKEWFLPKFQKFRAEIDYLDGTDLDRFSRYQFSFFGDDALNGFSGSGVRFDQGAIARATYSFNLLEAIRFSANVETAQVERADLAIGRQSFTGLGLSANFVAPWKTVININYGYALSSDIPDLEGEQEFLVLILKLF